MRALSENEMSVSAVPDAARRNTVESPVNTICEAAAVVMYPGLPEALLKKTLFDR
jgi:hypothetical protein